MKGDVLWKFWNTSGLTQKELAAKVGISQSALTQQFNSEDVRTGTAEKFCEALGLKINDLYEGTPYYSVPGLNIPDDGQGEDARQIMKTFLGLVKQWEDKLNMKEDEIQEMRKELKQKEDKIESLYMQNMKMSQQLFDKESFEKTGKSQEAAGQ